MPHEGSRKDAIKLRNEWYGNMNSPVEEALPLEKFPKHWVVLGRMKSITYESDRIDPKENPKGEFNVLYEHKFSNDDYLPLLVADPYKRFFMVLSNLDIVAEGIIDKNIKITKNQKPRKTIETKKGE